MKRIISFILVLSALIFLTPDLKAQAQEIDGVKELSSVQNYKEYLSEKSKNEESANEILNQFLGLSEDDQELFIRALQPQNYFKILKDGQDNPDENMAVLLDNGQEIDVQLKTNSDQDVKNLDSLSLNNSEISTYATYTNTTAWASVELAVLGITTSKFQIQMKYQTDGKNALQVYSIYKNYYNYNPGAWTTDVGYMTPYIAGGYGYGGYQWKVSSTASLGGISTNLDMEIKANHTNAYYRVISGRAGWSQGWGHI